MHNYTTTTKLNDLNDIYNFRTKIFDVVELLSGKELYASRIASGLSTHLSKLIKINTNCCVETTIILGGQQAIIKLSIPFYDLDAGLAAFFETHKQFGEQLVVQQSFSQPIDSKTVFEGVEKILSQKTKEELMREVEAQNIELQRSFENLKKTNMEKARMENELSVAKDIQLSMLPLDFLDREDLNIYAKLIPAREVGGDFYDFYVLDEEHLGLVVGDVSGKGVPAALMMAVCKTLLKSRASADYSTASILSHVNSEMAKDNKNHMFVTVFMAIFNIKTGELTYSNAGHNPTYIKKEDGSLVKLTELHGPVVAAMGGLAYKESKVQLQKGDVIFAYTDGIVEAHNANKELFSDQRLHDILLNNPFDTPKKLIDQIVNDTLMFSRGVEQFDDITALCIEYKGMTMENFNSKKITIKNTLEEIQKAIQTFEEFAEVNKMSMAIMIKVNIVLDELLSNIVKYGFPEDKEGKIDMNLELFTTGKLKIVLSDQGIPFNPFQIEAPDLNAPLEDREIGGLGIHIVKELMDEYSYERTLDLNVVSMTKLKC